MRVVKTYEQFINESLMTRLMKKGLHSKQERSKWWEDGKRLKAAARQYLQTSDEEERERIKADLEAEGVDMSRWMDYLGDGHDEKQLS